MVVAFVINNAGVGDIRYPWAVVILNPGGLGRDDFEVVKVTGISMNSPVQSLPQ
jgi:hypothetical protein